MCNINIFDSKRLEINKGELVEGCNGASDGETRVDSDSTPVNRSQRLGSDGAILLASIKESCRTQRRRRPNVR